MSDSKYYPPARTLADWDTVVRKQLGGADPHTLDTITPEGILLKALYTAEDTAALAHANTLPGFEPFVRGPQATGTGRAPEGTNAPARTHGGWCDTIPEYDVDLAGNIWCLDYCWESEQIAVFNPC